MADDLLYKSWSISTKGWKASREDFYRNIFFQGNGRLGLRSAIPGDTDDSSSHGVYFAGLFREIKPGITDMVNMPDPFYVSLSVDGEVFESCSQADNISQSLDMHTGILRREWDFSGVHFVYQRVVSFADHGKAAISISFASEDEHEIRIMDVIDASVRNRPVNDDQCIKDEVLLDLIKGHSFSWSNGCLLLSFDDEGYPAYRKRHSGLGKELSNGVLCLLKGRSGGYESVVSFSGEGPDGTFESIAAESAEALALLWDKMDVCIDGPEADQCALRFNIFTLIQNAPDSDISIGARGLTHGRYKGNYFWDTDVFMLPYYLIAMPETAGHLAAFRINMLPAAMKGASDLNLEGARYPWMCSTDGLEQCESWDTGKCEIHITADVVWALERYLDSAGDEYREKVSRVFIETARYWRSRLQYIAATDEYRMLFVKGPDEYSGVSADNAYTSAMARHNIRLAVKAYREGYRFDMDEAECRELESIASKIRIPYSETLGTYLEDENYMLLEEIAPEILKQGNVPLYHTVCFDRLQRYKLIKQPDVLLLYIMLPGLFSREEAFAAWREYAPRTLHDSTLSWGMTSLAAYRLGLRKEGYDFFRKALFLDLEDLMENTSTEGLHVGAAGTLLEALFFGMLSLDLAKGISTGSPSLPEEWGRLSSRIWYREEWYVLDVEKEIVLKKIFDKE